jgi:hypothetical protein
MAKRKMLVPYWWESQKERDLGRPRLGWVNTSNLVSFPDSNVNRITLAVVLIIWGLLFVLGH